MSESDIWVFWNNALKGDLGPIHPEPEQGFYRTRDQSKNWAPVAIWKQAMDDGFEWRALLSAEKTDALKIWPYCCRYPITHEAYQDAIEGKGFSDEPPAWVEPNTMPDDPVEALRLEFLDADDAARAALKVPIATQAEADRAAILSKRLAAIATKATGLHKTEKQPHLDAGRAVDDKWRALKDEPDARSKELKRHQDKWLIEQKRLEEDRQRKAKQEADRLAAEAAELAAKAQQGEQPDVAAMAEAQSLLDQSSAAQREAEARSVASGRTGAKVTLRTFYSAEITDYDKLLMALKDREEIKEVVTSLANRAAKSGFKLDGMNIKEEQRAV